MYIKRKYQVGGIAYTPYLPAQTGSPQTSATAATTTGSSSSSSDKISGTMKKEIVDLLKENGIPSDVSVFLNTANRLLANSQSLSQLSIFGGDREDYDISDLIKVQQLVNNVKYNKGLRDEAAAQIEKENAGSEVAVSNSGELYVFNSDGKLTTISAKEYADNKDHYQVLTNSQLMYYRENQPELAFQTGILDDLHNTIGMGTITKYLRDTINAFGSDTLEGYTVKNPEVKDGLQLLMQAGPDGYYKFTKEEELRDVNRALHYLYNGMSDNAKNLLKAKAAVEGGDPTDLNDISNLMYQALMEHTSRSTKVSFDKQATEYDPNLTGKKGGSSSEQLTQNNYLQQIGNKRLYKTNAAIVPMASQVWETGMMTMPVYTAGAPIDRQGDVLDKMSLSEFRTKAVATKAGDMSSITFGNRVLKGNESDLVMYDGSSELNIVMLPYKHDSETSQLMPDFTALTKFNELQRFLKEHPGASEMEIAERAKDLHLNWNDLNYDSRTNSITIRDTMPFITFSAYVGSDAFNVDKSIKPFLEHVADKVAKPMLNAYNNVINYGTAEPKKSDRKLNNYNTPERWDFYKGNVYVPMENAARAMLLSGIGEYVPKDQMTDFAQRVTAREIEVAQSRLLQEQDPNYQLISQQLGKF